MISMEETEAVLSGLLDELPEAFFAELNGGVCLLPEAHQDPGEDEIYILGEYCEGPLGRSIVLYYGSFVQVFGDCSQLELRRELRSTLRHEFRHHVEALAGVDDLDLEDARELAEYRRDDEARREPEKAAAAARKRGLWEGRLFRRKT